LVRIWFSLSTLEVCCEFGGAQAISGGHPKGSGLSLLDRPARRSRAQIELAESILFISIAFAQIDAKALSWRLRSCGTRRETVRCE
jgi:hypothetical protein